VRLGAAYIAQGFHCKGVGNCMNTKEVRERTRKEWLAGVARGDLLRDPMSIGIKYQVLVRIIFQAWMKETMKKQAEKIAAATREGV
jgi:hypothetical protein